jgi:hypothetical protein
MPITNDRIPTLAQEALKLADYDIARAVRILSELSGLSFEASLEAIDNVCPPDFDNRDYFAVEKPHGEPL